MGLNPGQWKVNARVTGSQMGTTQTGKEQLVISFETDDEKNKKISKYLFFTDKSMDISLKALVALGWKPEDHDYNITLLNGTDVLVGREATLVLENEEYNGKTTTKVVFVNSKAPPPMDAASAEAFGNTLRDRLMKARFAQDPNAATKAVVKQNIADSTKMPFGLLAALIPSLGFLLA